MNHSAPALMVLLAAGTACTSSAEIENWNVLATNPIVSVGHGVIIGPDGNEVDTTPRFFVQAQRYYLKRLYLQAPEGVRAEFKVMQQRAQGTREVTPAEQVLANSALLTWLIERVNPEDATQLRSINSALKERVMPPRSVPERPGRPPGAASRFPISEPSVSAYFASWGATRSTRVVAPWRRAAEVALRTPTELSGPAYISACQNAGVPTPPDWGTASWISRGTLTQTFIGGGLTTDVFTYESANPPGICFALPRSSGNTIKLLGIICQGNATSKSCYWDNQTNDMQFNIPKNTVVPISSFAGGAELEGGSGDVCTDCHAGNNPFVVHPGSPLDRGAILTPNGWNDPLVSAKWPQNGGPTTILEGVVLGPGDQSCLACHGQGTGRRFPFVSSALPGFCSSVLGKALASTMPPGNPGNPAYAKHTGALTSWCARHPSSLGIYTAVWQPSTEGEIQVYAWPFADFKAKYDALWPQNWRLKLISTHFVEGQLSFTAVWRPSTEGETQVYGWAYPNYRARYDSLWPLGWRLKLLNAYADGNQVRYTAVWHPSTEAEVQEYNATYDRYRAKYDSLWPLGWRLKLLNTYVLGGQVRYTAVWRPSTEPEIQEYGRLYPFLKTRYDQLWGQGWRLKLLTTYILGGEVRYTAVWRPSTAGEIQLYSSQYQPFRARYDELWPQGWRLKLLTPWP